MKRKLTLLAVLAGLMMPAFGASVKDYVGNWALTLPNGRAGWLGVEEKDGKLAGSLLWGGGSVLPVKEVKLEDGKLVVVREIQQKRKDAEGKEFTVTVQETSTATVDGDALKLVHVRTDEKGKASAEAAYTGKKIPAHGARPDLAKLKFGAPIQLFNGKDLTGWRLINEKDDNGWSVDAEGNLINRVEGKKHFGNLRTDAEFEDFNLKLEVRTQEKSNSGIYLRGIYEIQVAETYGKPVDSHNMGGLYSRITPAVAAEKPIGEWQTMDITLVDRHVTVVLNGKTIIDNQPALGCTGGALTSDEFKPGPIYLQGDHTNIDFRNLVLTPIVK